MYELYKINKNDILNYDDSKFNSNYSIEIVNRMKCNKLKDILMYYYWFIITKGGFKMYIVKHKDQIIHYSYLISKCYKFPFMSKYDFEIGPCFTNENYRGQGIYPSVLKRILTDAVDNTNNTFMIIDDSNISSINGVKKLGFLKINNLKKDKFKRYVITR
jgi:hypothetical protein